jgi:NAD(P)-dependent dehydrogenase (short-subunit alcohol dehydrogenase family)
VTTTPHRPTVVLVTGASSGIGKACVERLHAQGYRVYGTSRHAEWPPVTTASSRAPMGQASSLPYTIIPLDVTSDESVARAVDAVVAREGRLDVLVNNAGFGIAGAVEDTAIDEAREQFEANFFGTMRMCRATLPIMRRQGSGCIVNVSSIAGRIGIPFQAVYSASKFAVEGFTEALRMEAAPHGIRVVLVEPGDFRTGFTANRRLVRAAGSKAYREREARALGVMEHDETHGASPDAVARVVQRIAAARSPRLRYVVGPLSETIALALKRLAPARLFELGVALYYKVR